MDGRVGASARKVAATGLLFALALVLSLLEGMVPLPIPIPGIKLGLSNIVVMYCLYLVGPGQAYLLGVLKSAFVLMVRGMSSALLSLCGGLLSITAMLLVMQIVRRRDTYTAVSVTGAVAHNVGQLAGAALLLREGAVLWYYLPVLAAVGVLVGTLTAVLLRAVLPALGRLKPGREKPPCNG